MSPHTTFLTNASHLLAQTSPQTSAHLTSHRTALILATSSTTTTPFTVPDTHREHACLACGHIFIPGQNGDTLTLRSDLNRKKPRALKQRGTKQKKKALLAPASPRPTPAGVSKLLHCGLCAATTVLKLPAPGRISRRSTAALQQVQSAKGSTTVEPAVVGKSASNANSKKRAKNRKAGLQALLDEKKKAQDGGAGGGLGLSLADFMMK